MTVGSKGVNGEFDFAFVLFFSHNAQTETVSETELLDLLRLLLVMISILEHSLLATHSNCGLQKTVVDIILALAVNEWE